MDFAWMKSYGTGNHTIVQHTIMNLCTEILRILNLNVLQWRCMASYRFVISVKIKKDLSKVTWEVEMPNDTVGKGFRNITLYDINSQQNNLTNRSLLTNVAGRGIVLDGGLRTRGLTSSAVSVGTSSRGLLANVGGGGVVLDGGRRSRGRGSLTVGVIVATSRGLLANIGGGGVILDGGSRSGGRGSLTVGVIVTGSRSLLTDIGGGGVVLDGGGRSSSGGSLTVGVLVTGSRGLLTDIGGRGVGSGGTGRS